MVSSLFFHTIANDHDVDLTLKEAHTHKKGINCTLPLEITRSFSSLFAINFSHLFFLSHSPSVCWDNYIIKWAANIVALPLQQSIVCNSEEEGEKKTDPLASICFAK